MIEIEKPTIECIFSDEDPNYGKFVVEPLERGYGTTLREQPEKNSSELACQVLPLLPLRSTVSFTSFRPFRASKRTLPRSS